MPTAIAGSYGKNFEHMPELGTKYGFLVVLGIVPDASIWLSIRSKRAR